MLLRAVAVVFLRLCFRNNSYISFLTGASFSQNTSASIRGASSNGEAEFQAPRWPGFMAQPGRSVPAQPNPLTDMADEHAKDSIRYRGPLWTPDRGAGFYQTQRERQRSPSLITTGRYCIVLRRNASMSVLRSLGALIAYTIGR